MLAVSGARPADGPQYAQFHNVVEEMALASGLPTPAVYVIDDPSPNAFATGISPNKAAITATSGLLAMMNREELKGVVSHEMSHIRNYDVRLILIVTTLIGMAGLLASLAWRSVFFMPPRPRRQPGRPARGRRGCVVLGDHVHRRTVDQVRALAIT